jgi:hypothetical protein
VMLAPLDAFHEQVVAVPNRGERSERGIRCGWQGDLDAVPRGFATEMAVCWRRGGRSCSAATVRSVRRATPTSSSPASPTGPTTAPRTGTARSQDAPCPRRSSTRWTSFAGATSRSTPSSSTPGSIRTRRAAPSTRETWRCHRRGCSRGSRATTCSPREFPSFVAASGTRRSSCTRGTSRGSPPTSSGMRRGPTAAARTRRRPTFSTD